MKKYKVFIRGMAPEYIYAEKVENVGNGSVRFSASGKDVAVFTATEIVGYIVKEEAGK